MASNINSLNIDSTFPIAGVDNDSQGFRTNFKNIQTNIGYAKTEIEDLQNKAILKSALSGGGSVNNNMDGTLFNGAEIYNIKETVSDIGSTSGTIQLFHTASHFWSVSTSGSIVVSFAGFPIAGKLGRIRLQVVLTSSSHTVTLPAAVSVGTSTIEGYKSNVITFAAAGTYVFEFLTIDQGATITIVDLTRPRRHNSTSAVWGNTAVTTHSYFDYANLTTSFSISANSTLLIDSISTLAAGTIYLPTSPTNGQIVKIASNNAITTLTLTANTGTILGKITTLAANSHVSYQYVAGPSKWFRIEN